MAFKESPTFPERIAFGAAGGPAFNTDVVTVSSGTERRNENWLESRQEYDVSQGVKTEGEFKAITAFFRAVKGRKIGFRFKDWTDHEAALTEGSVDGLSSTSFQLVKKYVSGSDTTRREIRKPRAAGFVLKDAGVTMVSPGDYSLETTTGVVTTTVPRTAVNLAWSGEFDVPVRFDVDKLSASVVNRNQTTGLLLSWDAIPLVEVRED